MSFTMSANTSHFHSLLPLRREDLLLLSNIFFNKCRVFEIHSPDVSSQTFCRGVMYVMFLVFILNDFNLKKKYQLPSVVFMTFWNMTILLRMLFRTLSIYQGSFHDW